MLNRVIFRIILYTKENKYNILVVFSFVFSISILGGAGAGGMHMINNKVTDVKLKVKGKTKCLAVVQRDYWKYKI